MALTAALATACASTQLVTERIDVSDLVRERGSEFGRELPVGSRADQMQDIAETLEAAVATPNEWRDSGSSITIDGETLVIRTTPQFLGGMQELLAEVRQIVPKREERRDQ